MELQVYGDSQLIINQVNDDYNTKDDKLTPYKQLVEEFKQHFTNVAFEQIPRIQNRATNAMAMVGYLLNMPNNGTQFEFIVEQLMVPTYEIPSSEYVCMIVEPESLGYREVYAYLHDQYMSLDLSRNQRKTLIRQASRHTIIVDTLYKKTLDGTFILCLNSKEAQKPLKEVHDGICGAHSSSHALAKKLLGT
ncbi:uncharacterized protein LOC131060672 [Cryptomeria japonica]|uniref:uncharacterized protein LOC131060672 n=1 Tax=Cryptomeria japonica TaxID=3369 RepID=UPI0025AD7399|nr:uncharacterized protein LOC131060672 [Cryptomeria japonica]